MIRFDYKVHIAFVGNMHVGKTSFMTSLTSGIFLPTYNATIGMDYLTTTLELPQDNPSQKKKTVKLHLWDFSGDDRFVNSVISSLKQKACILICDLTNKASFEALEKWLELIKNNDGRAIALIGTKTDLVEQQQISKEEMEAFCKKHGIPKTYSLSLKNNPQATRGVMTDAVSFSITNILKPNHVIETPKAFLEDYNDLQQKKQRAIARLEQYHAKRVTDWLGASKGPYSGRNKLDAAGAVIELIETMDSTAPQCPPVDALAIYALAITQKGFLGFGRKRLGEAYQEANNLLGGLLPSMAELENIASKQK